jgi:hypothetical protein
VARAPSTSLFRRYRTTIVLAVIASVVVFVATRYEHQRQQRIESFVRAVLADIAADRDLSGRFGNTSPMVARHIVAQIRSILDSNPHAADVMSVDIVSGDPSTASTAVPSSASHTAILRIETIEQLRLGLVDHGAKADPSFVSYSVPGGNEP